MLSDRSFTLSNTPWTTAPKNGPLTSTDGCWTQREANIVRILEQHDEFTQPGLKLGVGGDDSSYPKPPPTYTHAVRQLERLMQQMHAERESQWWHVNERYLKANRTTKTKHRQHGRWIDLNPHEAIVGFAAGWELTLADERGRRRQTPTEHRVAVAAWNPAVRAEKVRRGVAWLAVSFQGALNVPTWEKKAA